MNKMHCTKCQINIARLASAEGPGDETYEFCPGCGSDMYLSDGTITEVPFVPVLPPVKPVFDLEAWKREREEQDRKRDVWIEEYLQGFDS